MIRLVGADRKSIVTQITTLYYCGEQKILNEQHVQPSCRIMLRVTKSHTGFMNMTVISVNFSDLLSLQT